MRFIEYIVTSTFLEFSNTLMIVYLNGVMMLCGGPSVLTVGVVHCPIYCSVDQRVIRHFYQKKVLVKEINYICSCSHNGANSFPRVFCATFYIKKNTILSSNRVFHSA